MQSIIIQCVALWKPIARKLKLNMFVQAARGRGMFVNSTEINTLKKYYKKKKEKKKKKKEKEDASEPDSNVDGNNLG